MILLSAHKQKRVPADEAGTLNMDELLLSCDMLEGTHL